MSDSVKYMEKLSGLAKIRSSTTYTLTQLNIKIPSRKQIHSQCGYHQVGYSASGYHIHFCKAFVSILKL